MNNKKTIWEFFIVNRRFTIILCLTIFFLGLMSVSLMPKESQPEVDIPIVVVSTSYPGASPQDVEELVTNVLEDKLLGLSDISSVSSNSYNSMSQIVVEFDIDADGDKKTQDVKDEIDKAKINLPDDANDPFVQKVSFESAPVLRLSLSGPLPISQLKRIAEELSDEIERVPGVNEVTTIGGREREIQVVVDKASLDKFGLALNQVTNAISQANSDIPIGSIETAGENYTVSFAGRIETVEDVENIPVIALGDSPVFVRDLATVVDGFEKTTSISRLSIDGSEPMSAISLNIMKSSGGSILDIADSVNAKVEQLKGDIIPDNVSVETIEDQSELVRDDLKSLSINGLETIIIVMLLLFVFVGWREALLAGLAIPLTFLITFIFLSYIGYTINFLTLFSLILALGILVDGAIVITEDMNKKINEGKTAKEAAILTVREFQAPLISGTLTTVFAFIPMMLTSGMIGKFIRSIPVTVSITLLSSLFVALGVVTALGSRWMRRKEGKINKDQILPGGNKKDFITRLGLKYEVLLRGMLLEKSKRRRFALIIAILFVFSLYLPAAGILKVNMFPPNDSDYFAINISEPFGAPIEKTSETAKVVENLFLDVEAVESMQTNIGSKFVTSMAAGLTSGDNLGHIIINLKENRKEKSFVLTDGFRKKLDEVDFGATDINIVELESGPPGGAEIEAKVTGKSLSELERISGEMAKILETIPGAIDVDTSIEETNGEFEITVNRAKAQLYGVTANQVALTLRNAVAGLEATVVRADGSDTGVVVKYILDGDIEKTNKATLGTIESLTIATPAGDIPLTNFVESRLSSSRAFIEHIDGDRVVKVLASSDKNTQPIEISKELEARLDEVNIPDGYSVKFGGDQEDVAKSFSDMLKAFILGVFAIAMLLVLQFNSYRQPFFILASIPLSVIGIFPGLVLAGQSLSFPGVIGMVALAGIVINNAILLIDTINNYRRGGLEITEAVVNASKDRLKPIILTTVTTVAGVSPLALSSPTWAPVAFSIIFGLLFSTVLTLLVVPLLYNAYGEKELDQMF